MKLLAILLFPLLALGQTVQINQGAQTSKGIAPVSGGGPTFPVVQSLTNNASYNVIPSDFAACGTIVVYGAPGGAQIQLPSTAPPNGQCIWILTYGNNSVAVLRGGSLTINGVATNYTFGGTGTGTPAALKIVSDGSNFIAIPTITGFGQLAGGTLIGRGLVIGNNSTLASSANGTIDANRLLGSTVPALSTTGYLHNTGSGLQWDTPAGGTTPSNLVGTSYSATQNGWSGVSIYTISNPANTIRATQFHYGQAFPTNFNTVRLSAQGVDAVNGVAVAIWDATAPVTANNHMLCHSVTKPVPTNADYNFDCAEGVVQLTPDHDYVFLSASAGTTASVYAVAFSSGASPGMARFHAPNVSIAPYNCTFDSTGISCPVGTAFPLSAQYTMVPTAGGITIPVFLLTGPPSPSGAPITEVATSYSSTTHGVIAAGGAQPIAGGLANRINGRYFYYGSAVNTTFSSVYMSVTVGDQSGYFSAVAIIDVTGGTVVPVCHSHPTATVNAAVAQFQCIEPNPVLTSGHDYIFLSTSNSPTANNTQVWGMSPQFVASRYATQTVTACGTPAMTDVNAAGIDCSGAVAGSFVLQQYQIFTGVQALAFWLQ